MAVDIIARGIASKKADLVNGKVPESQLPSYVDDVLEYANYSSLPKIGESGKIYVTLNDNLTYRWSGSTYVQVGGTYGEGTGISIKDNIISVNSTVATASSVSDEASARSAADTVLTNNLNAEIARAENAEGVLETALLGKQATLVSGTNIKTINGNNLLGSGNIAVRTYQAFPSTFVTTGTVKEFVSSVLSTSGVGEGMAYLGELRCSDLPTTPSGKFNNIEATVSMITDSIMVIEITTGSKGYTPYMWKYNSALGQWTKWTDVIANPSGTATSSLSTLSIDGVIYSTTADRKFDIQEDSVTTYALSASKCPKFSSRTSDLTLTLATTSETDANEYKAEIITSNAITLTMPASVINIQTNDSSMTISGTTVSIPASSTIEISIWDGKAFVYNWSLTD